MKNSRKKDHSRFLNTIRITLLPTQPPTNFFEKLARFGIINIIQLSRPWSSKEHKMKWKNVAKIVMDVTYFFLSVVFEDFYCIKSILPYSISPTPM